MIVTRKIGQLSSGKASQPYRFGAWQPRAGERIGKGKEREKKVKSWYKVQTDARGREVWTVDCRPKAAARTTSLSRSSEEAQHQQQQEDSDEGGV